MNLKLFKLKFPLQRLLILIALVLLTTLTVGSIIWQNLKSTITTQKNHIQSLNNQISEYSEKIQALSE